MVGTGKGIHYIRTIENMDRENLFLNIGSMKAPVIENLQSFGIYERRYTPVTEFAAQSNVSIHRKGREEHKAQLHKSLISEDIIRTGTRISRIGRIYTDPCLSASTVTPVDCVHTYASALAYVDVYSALSVFYRAPPMIDDDKKPQMNADKRRFVSATFGFFFKEQSEGYENNSN